MLQCYLSKPLAPLDEFSRENLGNSSSRVETRNFACRIPLSGTKKEQPAQEILQIARKMADGIS